MSHNNSNNNSTGLHKYRVILGDPPWNFRHFSGKNTIPSRADEQPYPPMSLEEMKKLPIKDLAHPEGCLIFLWTTKTFFELTFELTHAWGLKYCTRAFLWRKLTPQGNRKQTGGYYTRGAMEDCWIFSVNSPKQVKSRSVWEDLDTQRPPLHSHKPDEQYGRIAELTQFRMGEYLELFARQTAPGFTGIGNEIDGEDIRKAVELLLTEPEYYLARTNLFDKPAPGANLLPASKSFFDKQLHLAYDWNNVTKWLK